MAEHTGRDEGGAPPLLGAPKVKAMLPRTLPGCLLRDHSPDGKSYRHWSPCRHTQGVVISRTSRAVV